MSRPFPHRARCRHRAPVVVHRPITRSLTLATRTQPHSVIPDHLRQLRVAQLALYRNSRVYHGTGGLYDSLDVVRRGQPIDSDDLQLGTTLTHHKCPSNRARKNADLRVTAVRTAKSSSNAPDVLRALLTQDMHTAYVQNKGQTLSRQAQEEPSSDQDKKTQPVSNCEMQLREQQSKAFTKLVPASGSAPSDRTFTSEKAAHNCAQDFQQSLHSTPLLHLHGDEYMQSRTTLDFKSTACSESVAINSLKRRHTDLNQCMEQASKVIKTALDGGQSEVRGVTHEILPSCPHQIKSQSLHPICPGPIQSQKDLTGMQPSKLQHQSMQVQHVPYVLLSTGTVKHGDRHSNIENGLKNSTPPYSSERPQVSHSASSLISMPSLNKSMPTYSPKTKVKQGLPWDEKHEEVPYDQTFYSQSSSPIASFIPGIGPSRLQALVSDNHILENNFLQQPQTFQDDKIVAESVSTSGDGHQSLPIGHSVRSMPSSSRSLPPSLKATSLPMHTGNGGLNKQTKFPHDLPSQDISSPSSESALTPKLAFDYTVPGLRYIHP
ncbi:hypothetical protein KP509_14G057300 [Ceratopteris richardii]|uniref:Uncharacterized protein n=1 Tax=Ceratopteris richardii TaxID=49495 RepID=A0A8T2TA42_CERRI|nr:hypothetical protein KP509_14G057300 [Ceratopteris richardii]